MTGAGLQMTVAGLHMPKAGLQRRAAGLVRGAPGCLPAKRRFREAAKDAGFLWPPRHWRIKPPAARSYGLRPLPVLPAFDFFNSRSIRFSLI